MEIVDGIYRMFGLMNILQWILRIMDYVAHGYCMQYYYGSFLEGRFGRGNSRESRFTGLLVMAAVLLQGMVLDVLEQVGFEFGSRFWEYAWSLGFAFFVGTFFYRLHEWKTFFAVLSFWAVELNASLLGSMELLLDDVLRGDLGDWMDTGRITLIEYVWLWSALTALYLFLCKVLLYSLLRRIVKNFREKELALHGKEVLQLLMPSLAGICLSVILDMQVYGVEGGFYRLFASTPFLCVMVTGILFFSLASIVHGVTMLQDTYALNRERRGRAVLEKQIAAMREYVGERERIWSGLRGMKHDMRNTLSVAMRLAGEGGEEGRLQAYLEQLSDSLEAFETEFRTGNVVADALLDMKCHEARKRIPQLRVDAEALVFPDALAIRDYDIGVILGNALDNAVEACGRLREEEPGAACFIRLSSFLEGEMLMMEIKNNFDGKVIIREGREFPETRKGDGESHGIGLANIKSTCEKYHGAVEWSVWERVFTLSVMLRNERIG